MSNLDTAKSLIQADLDHARNVLNLWSHQVSELERAMEQLEAVGTSRDALRIEYRGAEGKGTVALDKPATKDMPKRGRKPKNANGDSISKTGRSGTDITTKRSRKLAERSTAQPRQVTMAKAGKTAKASKLKGTTVQAKFKDPNSDRTWSGRGRRPLWMTGDAAQYAIDAQEGTTPSTEGSAVPEALAAS